MVNTKKITGSTLALVVVSVLLVMSLTLGITLAWFNSQDSGTSTIKFAETFTIEVTDNVGTASFNIFSPGDAIIPGSLIALDGAVKGKYENTGGVNVPFLLRVKFDLTVSKDGTNVASGGNSTELEQVYTAFYNSVVAGVHKTKNWVLYNGYFYYIGAEADVTYRMDTPVPSDGSELTGAGIINGAKYTDATKYGTVPTEEADIGDLVLTSIHTTGIEAVIPFMTRDDFFKLNGRDFGNAVAGAEISVTLTAQAVQDLIYNVATDGDYVIPTIAFAETIFNDVAWPAI